MKDIKELLIEKVKDLLEVKKDRFAESILTEASTSDTNGKMHELLTGHYLNGGKHMSKESEEQFKTMSAGMSKTELEEHHRRGKVTADHIRELVHNNGDAIEAVHHTSKAGDIGRITGKEESQQDNPSDVMIKLKSGRHLGVSLKTVSKANGHAGIANPGRGRLDKELGVDSNKHFEDAHKKIEQEHPQIAGRSMKDKKAQAKEDEHLDNTARGHIKSAVNSMRDEYISKISAMKPEDRVAHFKEHAHMKHTETPHIRVTAHGAGEKVGVRIENPGMQGDDIKHVEVHPHGDGSIAYHVHTKSGEKHVYHMRFKNESGPFSPIKGSMEYKGQSKENK
jgi:hypothetical protein